MHQSASSSSLNRSLLQLRLGYEKHKWLVFATVVNYITYSSWTLLNKYQFSSSLKQSSSDENHDHHSSGLGVDCPVFSTGLQMLLAGIIACSISVLINKNGKVLLTPSSSSMSLLTLLKTQILPLGIARAIDIGCGNAALALVSVALQQILKSLLPLFVCLLSFFVLGKRFSAGVWLSLVPIVIGSLLSAMPATTTTGQSSSQQHDDTSQKSTATSSSMMTFGIVLALVSTFGRSMKAVLNAKLLSGSQKDKTLPLAPLEVLSLEAPTSGILLLVGSMLFGNSLLFLTKDNSHHPQHHDIISDQQQQQGFCHAPDNLSFIRINVFAGILMFFNQLSYISVIKFSSALSCQVLMNLKMSLLIIVSIMIFATPLSGLNMVGMVVAFLGCIYYALVAAEDERTRKKKKAAEEDEKNIGDDDQQHEVESSKEVVASTASSSSITGANRIVVV